MAKVARQIIKIDEEKCNGCGLCVPACAEGALQIVDGKARLVQERYCDGLGACLGECPQGAISFETREAEDFDEAATIEHLKESGRSVQAHLDHMAEHAKGAHDHRAPAGHGHGHGGSTPGNPRTGRNQDVNFRGERRSNDTHASTTDPDARLAKIKGKEAKLSYRGHILVENRNGLIADCELTQATGTAEPEAAATMLGRERTRRELELMAELLPFLKKQSGGRTISGLSAYE